MECKVCNDVLDGVLRDYLRLPKCDRDPQMLKCVHIESPIIQTIRPLPSSPKYLIIKASIASETAKAYNFRVMLNPKMYKVVFPFTPALYIWMPKTCANRVNGDYFEVVKFMGMENLNKSMITLKKKLIDSYGFSASEILLLKEIHLL